MNIQVNKHQLERVVIKWLNKYYGNLIPKKDKDRPNLVFYLNDNNQDLMEYDKEMGVVYIDYNQIWSKIESLFSLNYFEVQSIMSIWLKDTYKLEGVKCEAQWG
jgi:hypothetical protein